MKDLFAEYKRFGIFGPSESGKTTLAKKISRHISKAEGRKSFVLDPVAASNWGPHAQVYTDDTFWDEIFTKHENGLVIVDDASVTIDRDSKYSGLFTTLRHKGHKLIVIGHNAGNLLPQMRDQLQRIFLFLQNEDSVKKWHALFPGQDLDQAMQLKQYQFITVANHEPLLKYDLTPP
jgi:ABC-type Mn2+/Zn2+ transport system ATPase subunit